MKNYSVWTTTENGPRLLVFKWGMSLETAVQIAETLKDVYGDDLLEVRSM